MNNFREVVSQHDLLTVIVDFVSRTSGLTFNLEGSDDFSLFQKSDGKKMLLQRMELIDVLVRKDGEGREFLQVNLSKGRKILVTDQLVGFKPADLQEVDSERLPKVVTTLDLLSVFEAIEEAAGEDIETLKQVFQSILTGGESIGFDLSSERSWLKRLPTVTSKASS